MATKSTTSLRERQAPQARVYAYIKDPMYGASSRRFVELLGFKSVQSQISMTASGAGTITFPNFKSTLIRYVSMDEIKNTEKPGLGQETTNTVNWRDFMSMITTPDGKNPNFLGLWNDVVLSRGAKPLIDYNGPVEDSSFMERSRSRGDVLETRRGDTVKSVNDNSLIHAVPFLNLFDPIFIDYMGQDGKWYAGFTGLINSVRENYARTGDQSISISFRDLTILLDNVSVISGWNMLSTAEANSNVADFIYSSEGNIAAQSKVGFADIFSSFDSVEEIIMAVVKRSQEMWLFENAAGKVPGEVGVRAFRFDVEKAYDYTGISGRRGSIQLCANENLKYMTQADFLNNDEELSIKHYMVNPLYPDKSVYSGYKKILIDPLLRKLDNIFIQKLFNRDFALFKDSLKSADQILNELAAKMFAYKYFDGNGNLIFELAKPNAIPNITDYAGRSSSTFLLHNTTIKAKAEKKGGATTTVSYVKYKVKVGDKISKIAKENNMEMAELIARNNGGTTKTPEITTPSIFGREPKNNNLFFWPEASISIKKEDATTRESALYDIINNTVQPIKTSYSTDSQLKDPTGQKSNSDLKKDYIQYTTLNFHGQNYILSPDDFISFSWGIDEAAYTTVVATESNYSFIDSVNDTMKKATVSLHGVAVADFDYLAKFGVRRFQTQALYNVRWPDGDSGARVLSYQSATILERVNCMADSGSFSLNQRPELQLGRTFINPIRMKSYLITGISNSWAPGAPHTTSLAVTYGHPIHKTLEVPWLAILMEPWVFFKDPKKGLELVTKVNEHGDEVVAKNSTQPKYTASAGGPPAPAAYRPATP